MYFLPVLITSIVATTSLSIIEPEHCADYNLDELPGFRAIVENDNEIPDSVSYSLNGEALVQVPRLNTDWPTYMQNYQNHGFSESPAPTDNTILWTAPVTGPDHEFPTPVVVNGIVYYPSNSGSDSLYALDSASGELIWKYQVGWTDDAVTVADGFVYTASDSILCLDALTGSRIWASGEADYSGSTPVVAENKVFCGTFANAGIDTSFVVCLDALDGSVLWSTSLTGCWLVSCISIWDDLVIVPTYTNYSPGSQSSLFALDRETGTIVWENSSSVEGYWDSSPVVVDSTIYIVDLSYGARAFNVLNGEEVWVSSFGLFATATPAYHDARLFYAADEYYCLDAFNGEAIWGVTGNQHGSSAIADGIVFYGDNSNSPDFGRLVALDCETGAEVWSSENTSPTFLAGSPSITDGVVYMAMHDWNLYAFGTGLKYTYLTESLNSQVGWNELIATSYDNGSIAASDTISYYINATGIEFEPSAQLELSGSPNPFSASTSISFSLSDAGLTSIQVYDLSGRIVSDLAGGILAAGNHSIEWNGCYQSGEAVSSGLYICRIESAGIIETTGLCLLK